MTIDQMNAILLATWDEGKLCCECGFKYTDTQRLEHFGTPCVYEQIGCHIVEGDEDIAECPGVQRAMEDEPQCGKPCKPQAACEECEGYWHRMRAEGYWVDGAGWTEKGWREFTK